MSMNLLTKITLFLSRWAEQQMQNARQRLTMVIIATLGFAASVLMLLMINNRVTPSLEQEIYSLIALAFALAFGLWAAYGYLCLCFGRILFFLLPEDPDADRH